MAGSGIRMTQEEYEMHLRKMKKPIPLRESVEPVKEKKPEMTKTEAEYERIYLRDVLHKFEGITLKMSNGHRYTGDFLVYGVEFVKPEIHEVKGSYKLQSYGRAKLAFDQCKAEFPCFKFVWAAKTKEGWDIR